MSSSDARSPRATRPARGHSDRPSAPHQGQHSAGQHHTANQHSAGQRRRPASSGSSNRPRSEGRSQSQSSGPNRQRNALDDLPIQVVPTEGLPTFAQLGLPAEVVSVLTGRGMQMPFPIQAATIPDALAGRDVLGRAATGSGKTLAFGLPMIAKLDASGRAPLRPRALVLLPTRELAMQVTDALTPLAHARDLRVRLVAGGLPINKQIHSIGTGVDILVATPGRLIDLLDRRAVRLDGIRITAIDEADHMADLGFLPVVRQLLDLTPADSQRLLFSATLDGDVGVLVQKYLKDPVAHALAPAEAAVSTMSHHVFRVAREDRPKIITQIAARDGRTIVFVRTKHGADRLTKQLMAAGVPSEALHSGRNQSQRTRALDGFRAGTTRTLVATDVAARGIHVDDVSLVVHADPPQDGKDYLHRSGRTARAGTDGVVVTLVIPDEERKFSRLLRDSAVDATFSDAVPGAEVLTRVAGAREPSGVPIAVSRPAQQVKRVGPSGRATQPRSSQSRFGQQRSGQSRSQGGRAADGGHAAEGGRSGKPARSQFDRKNPSRRNQSHAHA